MILAAVLVVLFGAGLIVGGVAAVAVVVALATSVFVIGDLRRARRTIEHVKDGSWKNADQD